MVWDSSDHRGDIGARALCREVGWGGFLSLFLTAAFAVWQIVGIIRFESPLSLTFLGVSFTPEVWAFGPEEVPYIEMSLVLITVALFIFATLGRRVQGMLVLGSSLVLCALPYFLTLAWLPVVLPFLAAAGIVLALREKPSPPAMVLAALVPWPWLMQFASLPNYLLID